MNDFLTPILFTALGALVLFAVVETVRILWYLSVSSRLTKSIQKFERRNGAAAPRILFIGDSTGHGTGTSDARYSIVGRIGADFPDAYIENYSDSGAFLSTARRILEKKANEADRQQFDAVIVMVGGMDLVYFVPLARMRSLLKHIIDLGKRCGREVVLISPNNTGHAPLYRFPLSYLYRWRAKQLHELYRQVAEAKHIGHASLYEEQADALSTRAFFAADNTHPNDEGYGLWYTRVKHTIAEAIGNV